jgi:hypothetical protein
MVARRGRPSVQGEVVANEDRATFPTAQLAENFPPLLLHFRLTLLIN